VCSVQLQKKGSFLHVAKEKIIDLQHGRKPRVEPSEGSEKLRVEDGIGRWTHVPKILKKVRKGHRSFSPGKRGSKWIKTLRRRSVKGKRGSS